MPAKGMKASCLRSYSGSSESASAGCRPQAASSGSAPLASPGAAMAMRGRLAGIEMLSYSVGPLAGQIRAGVVADLWSVRASIASGGFACVAGVTLTAVWLRDFWSYDERTDPYAEAERARRRAAGESV